MRPITIAEYQRLQSQRKSTFPDRVNVLWKYIGADGRSAYRNVGEFPCDFAPTRQQIRVAALAGGTVVYNEALVVFAADLWGRVPDGANGFGNFMPDAVASGGASRIELTLSSGIVVNPVQLYTVQSRPLLYEDSILLLIRGG